MSLESEAKDQIINFFAKPVSLPYRAFIKSLLDRGNRYTRDEERYRVKRNNTYIKTLEEFEVGLVSFDYRLVINEKCFNYHNVSSIELAVMLNDVSVDINHNYEEDAFLANKFGVGLKNILFYLTVSNNNEDLLFSNIALYDRRNM